MGCISNLILQLFKFWWTLCVNKIHTYTGSQSSWKGNKGIQTHGFLISSLTDSQTSDWRILTLEPDLTLIPCQLYCWWSPPISILHSISAHLVIHWISCLFFPQLPCIEDFAILKAISRGAFGWVQSPSSSCAAWNVICTSWGVYFYSLQSWLYWFTLLRHKTCHELFSLSGFRHAQFYFTCYISNPCDYSFNCLS